MTKAEWQKEVDALKANGNRQPADDARLEELYAMREFDSEVKKESKSKVVKSKSKSKKK